MNIAIDIDDTITNTFEYLQPYTAEYCSHPLEELKEKVISYDNTPPEWGLVMNEFAKKYFDLLIPNTPVKDGAADVIRALRRLGHRIIIITHRNNTLYSDCYLTTQFELKNCGIEYDLLICTGDKLKACQRERVDLLIDDTFTNLDSVSKAGIDVLMFLSPVNGCYSKQFKTVKSWDEIRKLLIPSTSREIVKGRYRHFKNKYYEVVDIAIHSETRERYVVYRALYGDKALYIRPYEMFASLVDKTKYPNVGQEYRFELVN